MIHESIDKDGRTRYQEWKDIPVKNEKGEVVEFHSIGHDETELVICRRELKSCRHAKEALMELHPHPVVLFDADGRFLGGHVVIGKLDQPGRHG